MFQIVHPVHVSADTAEYLLGSDVVFLRVDDGSARLLDLNADFYALSATGSRMVEGVLRDGRAATVRNVANHFGVSEARVRRDLDRLLAILEDKGLVQPCRSAKRRSRSRLWLGILFSHLLVMTFTLSRSWSIRAAIVMTLTRLSFACSGWARTVKAFEQAVARLPQQSSRELAQPLIDQIDHAVRQAAAGHSISMACKERALCCWTLLNSAGIRADLVVGISLVPMAGHCWCEVGEQTLSDDKERCLLYEPVVRYTLT